MNALREGRSPYKGACSTAPQLLELPPAPRSSSRCDRKVANQQLMNMNATAGALTINASSDVEAAMRERSGGLALSEFERVYRGNVRNVTAFFARRCKDPQIVADLTSETIVRAAAGFDGFDPRRGTARAWLCGIAGHVFAQHCAQMATGRAGVARLAGLVDLPAEEIDELLGRIDAQRAGRELLERCAALPRLERAALELVDLDGLTPKEAAAALGVSRGVLRMRLSRARARLREEHHVDEQI
jgi:RNA polymerase sigma factor (sigma-70 family)